MALPVCFPGARLEDRYDVTLFSGRLKYCLQLTHPRNFLFSHANLVDARSTLAAHSAPNQQLWEATQIVAACENKLTGETLPWYARLCGWPVVGALPVAGLVYTAKAHPQSIAMYAFFHWTNQTHIAGMTYLNSSSTGDESSERLLVGYTAAMLTAVGMVLASRAAMNRSRFLQRYSRFAPLPAAAAANTANILCVRSGEVAEGVEVCLEGSNEPIGTSKLAAAYAIGQTTLTRWVLPMGNFVLAPLIIMGLEKLPVVKRMPRAAVPIQMMAVLAAFSITLPSTFALFPGECTLPVGYLEEYLQERVGSEGVVHFPRGL